MFAKLQGTPPDSLKLRFARFFHLISARLEAGYGADYFMAHAEKIQEGIFAKIYPPFVLVETEKLARPIDRKLAVISLTKVLCDSQAFAQKFAKGWANTCKHLLALLVNPPVVSAGLGDELIAEADVDDIGFGLTYTALNTCKPIARDDFPEVTAVTPWVSAYISSANGRHNGAIMGFINERLSPEQQQALQTYLQ